MILVHLSIENILLGIIFHLSKLSSNGLVTQETFIEESFTFMSISL